MLSKFRFQVTGSANSADALFGDFLTEGSLFEYNYEHFPC